MRVAIFICTFLLSTGCAVGPNYKRPQSVAAATFENLTADVEGGADTTTSQLAAEPANLAHWWNVFNDATLNSLITRAIRANHDLQIAEARVRETRAARGIAAGDFWPQIDAAASQSHLHESENVGLTRGNNQLYQLGFDAVWEIDFFGNKRRAWEAARADLQAMEERRRDVLITLLGDVAQTYIDFRGFQARRQIAAENIKAQEAAVEIAKARLNSGIASELDVSQAEALLAATRAQVPFIETLLKASGHRLGVLLGQPPTSLRDELLPVQPIPSVPKKIATGLPAELLRRRPDIRVAERELAGATARIGVVKGNYFPTISLLGSFGLQAFAGDDWLTSDSRFWSIGPSLRWPIFAAGKIRWAVKAENARQEQALARYEKVVLIALEETENAIVAFLNEQVRHRYLTAAVAANRQTLALANRRYLNGLADFLNVVDAQRSLYSAEDQWVQSERTVSVALVSLYKALGGGWED